LARDVTYRPPERTRSGTLGRPGPWLLAALLAANVGVFVYHGDPRDQLPSAAGPAQRAKRERKPQVVNEGAPLPRLDPTVGIHTPGEVQRVATAVLKNGQTVADALIAVGATAADVNAALSSLRGHVDFRRLRPGHVLKARFDRHGAMLSLDVLRGPADKVRANRGAEGYEAQRLEVPVATVTSKVEGEIRSSLWEALTVAREDPRLAMDVAEVFAWSIDFYTEVYPGDTFRVLVEKRYAEGVLVGYGPILAAEFVTAGVPHQAFLHKSGDTLAYHDENGDSLKKQLLKTPLKYAFVTSGFGSRRHPVLGYTRAHNGVDYGVPNGTPVWSVADGRVSRAGWGDGFGKLVEIRHANGWTSQYAHLSSIQVRQGQHVSQKDIIGLTGQTGLSSGPHLHYGLKKEGGYVDPQRQKFERGKPLSGETLSQFKEEVARLKEELGDARLAHESPMGGAPVEG
jgi:murein DD-endopeptidase MepM/ murein hydrolase activator NlpD